MAAKKSTKSAGTKTSRRPASSAPKKKRPAQAAGGSTTKEKKETSMVRRQVCAVVLFAAALLLLAIVLIDGAAVWGFLRSLMFGLFGICAYVWPALLIYIAVLAAMDKPMSAVGTKIWESAALVVMLCSAIHIFSPAMQETAGFFNTIGALYQTGASNFSGGVFGGLVGMPLIGLFGTVGAKIIICLLIFVFFMLMTGTTLIAFFKALFKPAQKITESAEAAITKKQEKRNARFDIDIDVDDPEQLPQHPVKSENPPKSLETFLKAIHPEGETQERAAKKEEPEPPEESGKKESAPALDDLIRKASACASPDKPASAEPAKQPASPPAKPETFSVPDTPEEKEAYLYPPTSLLERSAAADARASQAELKANAALLVDTLRSFGVETRIINISRGPAVTRYELQPSAGVKISKITNLADDIALNLASAGVRIEAPIPNKPAVGIEVPNREVNVVHIRELLENNGFVNAKSRLTVALGRDIAGSAAYADLAKMPHMLIAGATGSGKSVCINSIILSLLYKASPDEVRLLMIDPKVVELGIYNGIPHLLVPVVTDPRKAAGALGWAVTEMLQRYKTFADNNVRDLTAYNALCTRNPELSPLPQIVIIIDELADLMMAAPNEVEDSICRLAQMARAAGMHLVIATQRPSVDVITGIIKANIPSRIAFSVSSQVDSRTILDMGGAEKLLGRGDMLFSPVGTQKPTRIQGCFVSDTEVESVVKYIKNEQETEYDEEIIQEIEKQAVAEKEKGHVQDDSESSDEMLPAAIECVVEAGMASTSLLQRRLRLGYARAGRLIDEMEQRGIVGPHEGSKPRQVLITRQQWLEMNQTTLD